MKKSDYKNPEEHIFYCDKSDWYVEGENGYKDWSKSQEEVERFWKLVRKEKMARKDYVFSRFVFPEFLEESFWKDEKAREFKEKADFTYTHFLGYTDFTNTVFLSDASFSKVKFYDYADFSRSIFSKNVYFSETEFSKIAFFIGVNFLDYCQFRASVFQEKANFSDSSFLREVSFKNTDFKKILEFEDCKFKDEIYLPNSVISFLKNLNAPSFSLQGAILEESHFYGIEKLENVNFQDSFLLSLNLSNKKIENCDFTGATIGAVQTRGWKPDKATLENTKFIYTDFEIKQTIDEDGEVSKTYHAKPESRVPAEGSFGEGDNVEFTIADFLLDPTKWSYSLNLPKEIRSGFLGYIKFFEDFLRVTENEEVEIRTRREGNKVRVEFLTNDPEKKEFIEQEFQEYMQNLTRSPEEASSSVDFSHSKSSEIEKDLFELKYENRIKDLQTELKYTQKLLLKEEAHNQTLLSIQQVQTQPQKLLLSTPIPIQTDLAEIKRVFEKGRLKKALKMLSDYCGSISHEFSSEATLLYGEFNRLEKQKSDYSNSEYDSKCSRISKRLMDILTEIEQENEGF